MIVYTSPDGMTRMTVQMIREATTFVWLTGRVLDQRRMAYFAGEETAAGALAELDGYAVTDGGYAFGLEPDIRCPMPQPLAAMTALRVLDEVDALDAARAAPICRWLGQLIAPICSSIRLAA